MSTFVTQARKLIQSSLKDAAQVVREHLKDTDLTERMKLILGHWKVEGLKKEASNYNGRSAFGFGIPINIGLRINDEAHFIIRVEIAEFKQSRNGFEHELILCFLARRRDIYWNNYPIRIPLAAELSPERILNALVEVDYKQLVAGTCERLFAEDFLRLTEGLPPRT